MGIAHAARVLVVPWSAAALAALPGLPWPACAAARPWPFLRPSCALRRPAWCIVPCRAQRAGKGPLSWPWPACLIIRAAACRLPCLPPCAAPCCMPLRKGRRCALRLLPAACCLPAAASPPSPWPALLPACRAFALPLKKGRALRCLPAACLGYPCALKEGPPPSPAALEEGPPLGCYRYRLFNELLPPLAGLWTVPGCIKGRPWLLRLGLPSICI